MRVTSFSAICLLLSLGPSLARADSEQVALKRKAAMEFDIESAKGIVKALATMKEDDAPVDVQPAVYRGPKTYGDLVRARHRSAGGRLTKTAGADPNMTPWGPVIRGLHKTGFAQFKTTATPTGEKSFHLAIVSTNPAEEVDVLLKDKWVYLMKESLNDQLVFSVDVPAALDKNIAVKVAVLVDGQLSFAPSFTLIESN